MSIKKEDIALGKFLDKVTYTSDPSPQNKLVISDADFLKVASTLKLVEVLLQQRK